MNEEHCIHFDGDICRHLNGEYGKFCDCPEEKSCYEKLEE